MKIVVAGLNHKTAPIEIREKLAFGAADTIRALRGLKDKFSQSEFVLLSTCNRVELYCASPIAQEAGGIDIEQLSQFLAEFHNLAREDFHDCLYVLRDTEAIKHLLTVTSSLDSMVVGESQIITQVKESFANACTAKSTGKIINRLFHCAFTTSKKVHTTTSISSGRTSVAGVAVQLAMQLFADVSSARALVIGAGEMAELLVQHLLHVDCKDITVVNRTFERAVEMAKRYKITGRKWDQLCQQFVSADIVISATGSEDCLFDKKAFKTITDERKGKQLLVVDIAVPRNFDPTINDLDGVYLFSIDDLSEVVEQNRKSREEDISKGLQIVDKSVTEFMDWFRSRDIGPLIGQMREQFAQISSKELDRFFIGDRHEASCRATAEAMVKRIVNRLLHCVIKNVDTVAQKHGPGQAAKLVDGIVRQAQEMSLEPENNEEDQ